ncbi:heat shock 22 kDa protein, mitochondrial [Quercus suber]|uniref:Heat shock 22 kDa protein n=1 Tax=Quercus suber TaxID=58331 RepID=A0AAW0LJA1_QUESU|nr:heat shock 22 kDa protein, mitochondrial-like [Quercus suber]POE55099.1 heat shock 22 kda protein, mitochondrial [Quercus suber]
MAPIIRRLISSPLFSNLLNHKTSTLLAPLSVRSFSTNLWTLFDSSDEFCSINCHGGSMTRTDQFHARRGTHDQITEYPWQLEGPQGTYEAKKVDDGLFVRVDMPGIDKSEVKINVEEDSLIIKGEGLKQSEHESSGRTYVGSIDLCPNFFKLDEAKAQMRNGILRLIIPKMKDGQKESKTVSQIRVE